MGPRPSRDTGLCRSATPPPPSSEPWRLLSSRLVPLVFSLETIRRVNLSGFPGHGGLDQPAGARERPDRLQAGAVLVLADPRPQRAPPLQVLQDHHDGAHRRRFESLEPLHLFCRTLRLLLLRQLAVKTVTLVEAERGPPRPNFHIIRLRQPEG